MTIKLESWCQYLNTVTPSNDLTSHSWICEVKRDGQGRTIEVLSQSEYETFSKNPGQGISSLRKLSLKEIIAISQSFFSNMSQTYELGNHSFKLNAKRDAKLNIEKLVSVGNTFSEDIAADTIKKLEEINSTAEKLQVMPTALEKMSQRAFNKRSVEKTESIWGSIKFYIWSWFFDKRGQVQEMKGFVPSLTESHKAAITSIQDRVLLNIEIFEDEIKVKGSERHSSLDSKTAEKFNSPSAVRKKWLTKYAEDKYQGPVSDFADQTRKRIIQMIKIWDALDKFKPTGNVSQNTVNSSPPQGLISS